MPEDLSATPLLALSNQLAQLAEGAGGSVVGIRSQGRLVACGFVFNAGAVVTASDALQADVELSLLSAGATTSTARLAGRDPTTDIAVLRVDGGLPGSALAAVAGAVKVGQLAVAVGRGSDGLIASMGIVAVAGGAWQSARGGNIDRLIRLDMRLNPRAEGGLVVDAEGRPMGMAVLGPRQRPLVIPVATIERVAGKLLKEGRIPRGYLGVGLHPIRLDEALATTHSLADRRAIMVISVDPNGPASRAGLLVGDVIVGFDGAAVASIRALSSRLTPESVGRAAELKVVRAGQSQSVTVTIGASQTP